MRAAISLRPRRFERRAPREERVDERVVGGSSPSSRAAVFADERRERGTAVCDVAHHDRAGRKIAARVCFPSTRASRSRRTRRCRCANSIKRTTLRKIDAPASTGNPPSRTTRMPSDAFSRRLSVPHEFERDEVAEEQRERRERRAARYDDARRLCRSAIAPGRSRAGAVEQRQRPRYTSSADDDLNREIDRERQETGCRCRRDRSAPRSLRRCGPRGHVPPSQATSGATQALAPRGRNARSALRRRRPPALGRTRSSCSRASIGAACAVCRPRISTRSRSAIAPRRATSPSRARARYDAGLIAYLNRLVARAHARVYAGTSAERLVEGRAAVRDRVSARSAAFVARRSRLCVLLTIVTTAISYVATAHDPANAYAFVSADRCRSIERSLHDSNFGFDRAFAPAMSSMIITNNIRVAAVGDGRRHHGRARSRCSSSATTDSTSARSAALFAHRGFGLDFWATISPHGVDRTQRDSDRRRRGARARRGHRAAGPRAPQSTRCASTPRARSRS